MSYWLMPGIPRTINDLPDMGVVDLIRKSIKSDTGQVVESDMLEPCPFCGGEAYVQVSELSESCIEARAVCRMCHVSTSWECQSWRVTFMGDEITRTLAIGRAISAWNRRVERTCRRVPKCSECGQSLGDERWSCCPKCGAKVEGE